MGQIDDGFKRTTISLRNEDYEALRYMAYKRKKSIAATVRELIYERIEEEMDIRDGMKALVEEDALDWSTFKKENLEIQD